MTCVHLPMLSPYCSSFIGTSRSVPHKHTFNQETSEDEAAGIPRPARKAVSKKMSIVKKRSLTKGKASKKKKEKHLNYKTGMASTEYLVYCRENYYSTPRDNAFMDRRFWCKEQSFVLSDVYLSYRNVIQ